MSRDRPAPEFNSFVAWLARQSDASPSTKALPPERYAALLAAARDARQHHLASTGTSRIEVLHLLAAADKSDATRPPELTTARGFRVTLAYEEGGDPPVSSICVLVRCPPELIASIQGETAYLWSGNERFELGQFDTDGKAIGTLPAGIEISVSDFALGRIKLEEPNGRSGL